MSPQILGPCSFAVPLSYREFKGLSHHSKVIFSTKHIREFLICTVPEPVQ